MLLLLFRALSRCPLPVLHALGTALGRLTWLLSPAYRRRLRDNLRQAGYEGHLNEAMAEIGKSVLELPFVWCAPRERVMASCSGPDEDLIDRALATGRPILFLTPHLGCFEITAQWFSRRRPITVMYRPPRKSALRPLMEDARRRAGMTLAPATLAGVRILLKTLKSGGVVGLLPDQVPQQGEGLWAPFFGRPAYTMTLPAKLAQMSDALVLLAWGERLPQGRGYVVRFRPFTRALEGPPEAQAHVINQAMEALIAERPAQYLWGYNRYKVPDGVAPPPAGGEAQA